MSVCSTCSIGIRLLQKLPASQLSHGRHCRVKSGAYVVISGQQRLDPFQNNMLCTAESRDAEQGQDVHHCFRQAQLGLNFEQLQELVDQPSDKVWDFVHCLMHRKLSAKGSLKQAWLLSASICAGLYTYGRCSSKPRVCHSTAGIPCQPDVCRIMSRGLCAGCHTASDNMTCCGVTWPVII